jgi:hypothetical protein
VTNRKLVDAAVGHTLPINFKKSIQSEATATADTLWLRDTYAAD